MILINQILGTQEPLLEGGGNFTKAGTIHKSEIPATLDYIGAISGLTDVQNRAVGSVGKKEFSGDIDLIAGYAKDDDMARQTLFDALSTALGPHNVKKRGPTVFALVPIQGFNSKLNASDRTGSVQVDFFAGDPTWLKSFYHAPGTDSPTKGAHRNVAINSIAALTGRKAGTETDTFGRPTSEVRYKFGTDGLMKVRRNSVKGKEGQWIKRQDETELSAYITDMGRITQLLFGVKDPNLLYSLETIVNAINKYRKADSGQLFKRIANDLHKGGYTDGFQLPKEIGAHL